jgi:hypothetical protein
MALESFVAGDYSSTWDPVGGTAATDLGVTEGGYEISVRHEGEAIGETDRYGASVVDGVHRGYNVACQLTALEWTAGVLLAAFPYSAVIGATGAGYLSAGVIGRLWSAVAGPMVLTATSGTPAAAAPATLTATLAIVHEGFDFRMVFDSKLRKTPLRFRFLPYLDTQIKWFSVT